MDTFQYTYFCILIMKICTAKSTSTDSLFFSHNYSLIIIYVFDMNRYYYTFRKNAEEYIAFTRHFSKTVNIARREKIFVALYL